MSCNKFSQYPHLCTVQINTHTHIGTEINDTWIIVRLVPEIDLPLFTQLALYCILYWWHPPHKPNFTVQYVFHTCTNIRGDVFFFIVLKSGMIMELTNLSLSKRGDNWDNWKTSKMRQLKSCQTRIIDHRSTIRLRLPPWEGDEKL